MKHEDTQMDDFKVVLCSACKWCTRTCRCKQHAQWLLTARVLVCIAHQLQERVVLVALNVVVSGAPATDEPHGYACSLQSLQDCGTYLTELRVG